MTNAVPEQTSHSWTRLRQGYGAAGGGAAVCSGAGKSGSAKTLDQIVVLRVRPDPEPDYLVGAPTRQGAMILPNAD